MKSRIKSKKPIKFGQTLTITNFSSPNVDDYAANLRKQKPYISHEELNREILELVKRDSYYNALMDEVASAYEFELDEEEVQERINSISQSNPNVPEENIRGMVEIPIYKKLIYEDLAKDWEVNITDEVVKDTLERFYKETGQPIREYLMNKNKFEGVRETLVEQLITGRLMNAFKAFYKFPEK